MALRSLVRVLKDLPRRMPDAGAFVPKGNPWSKSSARLKYDSTEAALWKTWPHPQQKRMLNREEHEKWMRDYGRTMALMGIVGFYVLARIRIKEGTANSLCLRCFTTGLIMACLM